MKRLVLILSTFAVLVVIVLCFSEHDSEPSCWSELLLLLLLLEKLQEQKSVKSLVNSKPTGCVTLLTWNTCLMSGDATNLFLHYLCFPQKNQRRTKRPSRQRRRRPGERHETTLQTSVCKRLDILFMQHLFVRRTLTRVFVVDLSWNSNDFYTRWVSADGSLKKNWT